MPKWSLLPREPRFFAFYQQQAENIVKMAQQLKDMIYVWQNLKERAEILADMEQDGDAITHDIMTLMHRTYITPFDREDIPALAYALDTIADRIHAVADPLYLYGIECPTERAKEMCDIIQIATLEVEAGVQDISSRIRKSNVLKRCVTINQIENSGDRIYRAALVELFEEPNDMATVVKWREIYQKMESTIDGCEDFSDVMEGIVLRYA